MKRPVYRASFIQKVAQKSIKNPKNSGEMAFLIFVICSSKQTLLFKHATYMKRMVVLPLCVELRA
jgi:hypothetical protein